MDCGADETVTEYHGTVKGRKYLRMGTKMNNMQACAREILEEEIILC